MDRESQMLLLHQRIPDAMVNGGLWNISDEIETSVLEEYCRRNNIHYLPLTPYISKNESALVSIVILLFQNIDKNLLSSSPISSLQDHLDLVTQVCGNPSLSLTSCIEYLYKSHERQIILHVRCSTAFPMEQEEMLLLHSILEQFRNRVFILFCHPDFKSEFVNELKKIKMDPIFISYSHSERCKPFVDSVVTGCSSALINYSIDFKDLLYGESIREYENMMGEGSKCIVIITEEYLQSPHCMYELTKIFKAHKEKHNKIYPLVDTGKYTRDSSGLDALRSYWTDKHKEIHANAKTPSAFTARELVDVDVILRYLDDIWEYLHDINTGDINELTQNNAEHLISAITRDIEAGERLPSKEKINLNTSGLSQINGDIPNQTIINQYGNHPVSFGQVTGSITINQNRN